MHNGVVIVCPSVIAIGNLLVEVVFIPWLNILVVDYNIVVTVLAALLVPQADRVPDLVDGIANRAP